jgi:hypothetical protein
MTTTERLAWRAGYALGALGAVAGLAVGTPQTAVLASLVGFFTGKSIRSTLRAVGC